MKQLTAAISIVLLCSFQKISTLRGTWEFRGGIYNGKKEDAPKGYVLHRKYDDQKYEALLLEKGAQPFRYEAGNYQLKDDTCIDTQTFSSEPSKITGIAVRYVYQVRSDTLILKATLPTGLKVEEYWRRAK
jgi:hypothetical protein